MVLERHLTKCFPILRLGILVENMWKSFIRELIFFDHNYNEIGRMNHDFGENNFMNNEDFLANEKVRFKYYARDLDGKVICKAYSTEELAELLGCHTSVIKRRLISKVNADSPTKHLFNVTRVEL
jgi:hypothetical protein